MAALACPGVASALEKADRACLGAASTIKMTGAFSGISRYHRLHIDRNWALVKGDKKKGFLEKFATDIRKATGFQKLSY